jgi:hypothetical protein
LRLLGLGYTPLERVILPKALADGLLYWHLLDLRTNPTGSGNLPNVSIFTYPSQASLSEVHTSEQGGAVTFRLAGPPGRYQIETTSGFNTWAAQSEVVNVTGSIECNGSTSGVGFYRATRLE